MACHNLTCGGGHKFKCPGGHEYGPFFITTNCKFNKALQTFFLRCIREDKKGKLFDHKIYMNNGRMRWKLTKSEQLHGSVQKLVREHIYACGWNCNLRKMLLARKEPSLKCMAQTEVALIVLDDDVDYQHFYGDYLLYLADESMKKDEISYENFSIE